MIVRLADWTRRISDWLYRWDRRRSRVEIEYTRDRHRRRRGPRNTGRRLTR